MARRKERKDKSEKIEKNRKSISKERRHSKDRKGKAPKERKLSKDRKTKDDIKMSKLKEKYRDLESLGESTFDGIPRSLLDATWNRLSDMEENLHVVLDVREDLMEQVMKECQERYITKQAIKFHVHCVYSAFIDLFGMMYLVRDPGPEAPWTKRLRPLEAPPPQPNLGDSWATGVLRRAPPPPHGKTEERLLGQFGVVDVPTYEGSRGPPTPPLLQPFDETLIRHEDEGGLAMEPPAPPPSMVMLPEVPAHERGKEAEAEAESEREERRKKRSRPHHKRTYPARTATPKHADASAPPLMSVAAAAAVSVVTAPRRPGSSLLAIEETLRHSRISVSRLPGDRVPVFALLKEQKRRSSLDAEEADARKDQSLVDPTTTRRELGGRLSATGFGPASKTLAKQRGGRHVRYRKHSKPRHEVVPPPTPTGPQPFRPPSPDFQVAPPRPLPRRPAPPSSLHQVRRVTPVMVPDTAMSKPPSRRPVKEKRKLHRKIEELPESSSSTEAPTDYDAYKSDPRMVKKHKQSDKQSPDKTKSVQLGTEPSRDISDTRLFRCPSDQRTQRVEERAAQLDVDLAGGGGGGGVHLPPAARVPPRKPGIRGRGRLTYGTRPPTRGQHPLRHVPRPRALPSRDAARGIMESALRRSYAAAADPRDLRPPLPESAPVAATPTALTQPTQPQVLLSPDAGDITPEEKKPDRKTLQQHPGADDHSASESSDRPHTEMLERQRAARQDTDHSEAADDSSDSRDFQTSRTKKGDLKESREETEDTTRRSRRSSRRGRRGSGDARDTKGRKDSGDQSEECADGKSPQQERPGSSDRASKTTKGSGEEGSPTKKVESPEQRRRLEKPTEETSTDAPIRLSFTPTPRDQVSEGERRRVKAAAQRAVDAAVDAAKWLLNRPSFQGMERGKAVMEAREALKRALEAAAEAVSQLPGMLPGMLPAYGGPGSEARGPFSAATTHDSDTLLSPGVSSRPKRVSPRRKQVAEGSDPCLYCPRIEKQHECPEKHEEDMLCECSDDSADMQQQQRSIAPLPKEEKRPPLPPYHHHKHHHRKERGEEPPHEASLTGPSAKGQREATPTPQELPQAATTHFPSLGLSASTGATRATQPARHGASKTSENMEDEQSETIPKGMSDPNEKSGKMETSRNAETRDQGETDENVSTADKNETARSNAILLQDESSKQGEISQNKISGKTLTPVKSASPAKGVSPDSKSSSPKVTQTILKDLMM